MTKLVLKVKGMQYGKFEIRNSKFEARKFFEFNYFNLDIVLDFGFSASDL